MLGEPRHERRRRGAAARRRPGSAPPKLAALVQRFALELRCAACRCGASDRRRAGRPDRGAARRRGPGEHDALLDLDHADGEVVTSTSARAPRFPAHPEDKVPEPALRQAVAEGALHPVPALAPVTGAEQRRERQQLGARDVGEPARAREAEKELLLGAAVGDREAGPATATTTNMAPASITSGSCSQAPTPPRRPRRSPARTRAGLPIIRRRCTARGSASRRAGIAPGRRRRSYRGLAARGRLSPAAATAPRAPWRSPRRSTGAA